MLLIRGPERFITVKVELAGFELIQASALVGSSTPQQALWSVFFIHSYPYKVATKPMLLPIIARLGAVGMGLTCGWLIGRFSGSGSTAVIKSLTMAAATMLVVGEVFLFSDWIGATLFTGSAALTLLLRLGWYRELAKRRNSTS